MKEFIHVVCPHCDTVNRLPAVRLEDRGRCGKCRKALFGALHATLTTENFRTHVERSDIPLVVDFWAPWCGACKMMAPAFDEAAGILEPRVRLAKVNTETEHRLAGQFSISSIPTLIVFKQGREVARQAGATDSAGLVGWVRSVL